MRHMIDKFKEDQLLFKVSLYNGAIMGIMKILLGIISGSISLFISSFYNIGISLAKKTTFRKNVKHTYENFYLVGIIILVSSIFYIFYSYHVFYFGSNSKYHMYIAILIATITFTDITLALIGTIKAKKKKDLQTETVKLINLATSLISLSLTQTAILSFTVQEDMSKYNGIGGMIFGICAGLIGIYMIIRVFKVRKNNCMSG